MTRKVGIQYSWFDYETPRKGCQGNGWIHQPNPPDGPFFRPFKLPTDNVVKSHLFPDPAGSCYSSMEPSAATTHAKWFNDLGIDFVIFDETNFSTAMSPDVNPTYLATKQAIQGFKQHTGARIKVVYQLSIVSASGARAGFEFYVGDRVHVTDHIKDIWQTCKADPSLFLHVPDAEHGNAEKPLMLFYLNKGNNVLTPQTNAQHFQGWGNVIPENDQFNPLIADGKKLRDLFTVRYAVWAVDQTDYTQQLGGKSGAAIWPFECMTFGTKFVEAGYASLHFRTQGRRLDRFKQLFEASKNKPYLIVRCFNEFSTTDEDHNGGNAFTIEVNTQLHHHDGSPNAEPFHMWNGIRGILKG